jgi:energy-coupling factor transporter ATP-binding protein EcfA2
MPRFFRLPNLAAWLTVAGRRLFLVSRQLLEYWRRCLADADLYSPDSRRARLIPVGWDALDKGEVTGEVLQQARDRIDPQAEGEDAVATYAEVQIALLGLRAETSHGKTRRLDGETYLPCWIPARLDCETGELMPFPRALPWMVRRHLEPQVASVPTIGTVEKMDAFLGQAQLQGDGWPDLLRYAENLFTAVADASPRSFDLSGWARVEPAMLLRRTVRGAGDALLTLYDHLTEESSLPALLASLAAKGRREPVDPEPLDEPAAPRHLGHMTQRFPLGPTQRESLHAALRLAPGELVAINGPPGTGKTTLVQSLVACLWVERALAGGEPPVIVACSTNNQAVTNVLASLASAEDGDGELLGRRWLDDRLDSYGLSFPAKSKRDSASKHLWASPGTPWQGLPARMENDAYCRAAAARYLAAARDYFGEASLDSLQEAVDRLRQELQSEAKKLGAHLGNARDLIEIRKRFRATDPAKARLHWSAEHDTARQEAEDRRRLELEIEREIAHLPLLEDLLAFLRPIKERRDYRLTRPFADRGLDGPQLPYLGFRRRLTAAAAERSSRSEARVERATDMLRDIARWEGAEADFRQAVQDLSQSLPMDHPGSRAADVLEQPRHVEDLLDRGIRRRLFRLAGRYWEGRWLLEMEQLLDGDPNRLRRQSRSSCRVRFRRFAKVTPLFVSTLHYLPRIFDYYKGEPRPLLEGIDLLIVDEAGQVSPEIGAVAFALAKRAVVIGDTWQIEPIWGIDSAVDRANLELADIDPERLETVDEGRGLRSSCGSLMQVAQRSTRFTAEGQNDGLWLREHRRSVPAVIEFCNRLVYRGRLEALRVPVENHPLPAMGWAHVNFPSEQRGTSRLNEGHAEAIARWLDGRRQELETFYGKDLADIVGIVTPYRSQAEQIRDRLRQKGLPLPGRNRSGIEVGTVHVFQGAERPVMLFSPTATRHDPPGLFFDRSCNMLNVAVSRARDCFLVIGDMEIFDPSAATPSGLLAKHLFAQESNELGDVLASPALARLPEVERIDTHGAHHELLCRALATSRERVLVFSPYLGRTLEVDGLLDQIRQASERGVAVTVVYCRDLDSGSRSRAWDERLRRTGATVVSLPRIHSKTLAVDSDWFVEGSFNWLSAVRDPEHPHHRHETSLLCGSREAAKKIQRIWEDFEQRRSGSSD